MEDTNRIRLIMIGIVLCAVAAGYLLFSQANKAFRSSTVSPSPIARSTPSPTPVALKVVNATPTPSPAAPAVAGRSTANQQSLPATGFPAALVGIFALSGAIIGYSLKKYPH